MGVPFPVDVYDNRVRKRLKAMCVVSASGCWEWQGFLHHNGYAGTCYRNKGWRAHRLSYVMFRGPIPNGHDVCHTCDNRKCINPDHLWTGPRQLNNRDTTDKGKNRNSQKTHCPRGHAYSEHGFSIRRAGYKGWRQCRICNTIRQRIAAGWPEALAISTPRQKPGHRVWNRVNGE